MDAVKKTERGLVDFETRRRKDESWTLAITMWSRPKIVAPILDELRKGVSHPLRSREDETSEQARVRITTENDKDNSRYVSAHSLTHSLTSREV